MLRWGDTSRAGKQALSPLLPHPQPYRDTNAPASWDTEALFWFLRIRKKGWASHGVSGVHGVFSCRFLWLRGGSRAPVSGGMALPSTRHEPAWSLGNAREIEFRRGTVTNFLRKDADRRFVSAAHGNRRCGPPDARSGEPSARSAIEVSGALSVGIRRRAAGGRGGGSRSSSGGARRGRSARARGGRRSPPPSPPPAGIPAGGRERAPPAGS